MIQSQSELELIRNLRDALDKSIKTANTMHLSEEQLVSMLEERWDRSSQDAESPNEQIENRYFNGLAGP